MTVGASFSSAFFNYTGMGVQRTHFTIVVCPFTRVYHFELGEKEI
jgi:hypothetical protein